MSVLYGMRCKTSLGQAAMSVPTSSAVAKAVAMLHFSLMARALRASTFSWCVVRRPRIGGMSAEIFPRGSEKIGLRCAWRVNMPST
jgi:hypothetical protein